jgi:hypothetical protein
VKSLIVELACLGVHEFGESDRGEVADSDFICTGVLNDLCAEIGTFNRA